ncbi:histidine phosphatase family protein [Pseudomonas sp. F1_0610]|uniref:histidine phosphatase family protein n=1 Tax=Pseudomonas sp. F1_0610 TaxID=3114284 RepID=UPI0039C0102C
MAHIYLVRHAQAQLNSCNYDQLSPLGEQQALYLAQHWKNLGVCFDQIYCGTLVRQQETCRIIQAHLEHKDSAYCVPELNEYNFHQVIQCYQQSIGHKESIQQLTSKDQFRLLRSAIVAWAKDQLSHTTAPSFSQFALQVTSARNLIMQKADNAKKVLVISSGGVIAVWLQTLLGLTPTQAMKLNLQLANTAVSEFYSRGSEMQLIRFNHISHLEHPQRISALTHS